MRQIVLDTETTGINPEVGHRIIEIGCIELIDRKLTKKQFHVYLNPERDIDEGAFRVHGLSREFLQDKPCFKDIVHDFVTFIKDSELIIHNAVFDVGFLNAEFDRINSGFQIEHLASVCDTLLLAREKHPGQRNSLDALCKRYEIDNSHRNLHGALLDAEILASVYLALTGGQRELFDEHAEVIDKTMKEISPLEAQLFSDSPVILANTEELKNHESFIQFLIKESGINLWNLAQEELI